MNEDIHKINSNNNNSNAEISDNISGDKYEHLGHDRDSNASPLPTESILAEPEMEKICIHAQYASRRHQADNKDRDEDKRYSDEDMTHSLEDNTKSEEVEEDELDGSRRNKSHILSVEEEIESEEIYTEELVNKKSSSTYAAKKTVAQGMMDIALITANANQLRYLIEFNSNSSTFALTVILIIISLCLQVCVGVALIFKGRLDIKGRSKDNDAKRINNYVVVAIFLVTIINVFIASFTITGGSNAKPQ